MLKLFEWIGSLIAIACLIEFISNPKQALLDIQRGPAPNLAAFNAQLHNPPPRKTRKAKMSSATPSAKNSAE